MVFRLHLRQYPRAGSRTVLSSLLLAGTVAGSLFCLPLPMVHAAGADNAGVTDGAGDAAPLLQGAGSTISTRDVRLEMQRLPPEAQAELLADPALLRQLIDTAYLRRALAARAEQQGLVQKDPVLGHLLLVTREGLLAEAELQRVAQAAIPDSAALEKMAQSAYKAESGRFNTPARTRARHILVRGTGAAKRAQAEQILAELRAGGDFAVLARQHSADVRSAVQGGDLGFFPKGQMAAPFDAALEELKNPGDLSAVVPGPSGFHIIRLEERKPASSQSYAQVREQLHAEITADLQKKARALALERLRAQAEGDADRLEAFIAARKQQLPALPMPMPTVPAAAPASEAAGEAAAVHQPAAPRAVP